MPDRRRVLEIKHLEHEAQPGYRTALWLGLAVGAVYLALVFSGVL